MKKGTPLLLMITGLILISQVGWAQSSPTEGLIINENGNVGIGTSSPSAKLEVNGGVFPDLGSNAHNPSDNLTVYPTGISGFQFTSTDVWPNGSVPSGWANEKGGITTLNWGINRNLQLYFPQQSNIQDSQLYLRSYDGTKDEWQGWKKVVTENSSGNVGIGTTNPKSQLQVWNTGAYTLGEDDYSTDSIALFGAVGNQEGAYFGGITWHNGGRRRAGIASVMEHSDSDFLGLAFFTRGTDGPGGYKESVRISRNGRVGIGDKTPNAKLDVVGSIHYTGTISDVSDARLKENITPIKGALDIVQNINGVYFTMKGTPEKSETGFIAQNVQTYLPSAVNIIEKDTGYLGVSYSDLIPVTFEAIKEQQEQIEHLTEKNEELMLHMIEQQKILLKQQKRIESLEKEFKLLKLKNTEK